MSKRQKLLPETKHYQRLDDSSSEAIELIETKEEIKEVKEEKTILTQLTQFDIHNALYFLDIPRLLRLLELKFKNSDFDFGLSHHLFRWIIENTSFSFPALTRRLQGDLSEQDATQRDIYFLIACILHNKPALFKSIKSLINTNSIPSAVIAQFYYLAMHFKRYEFFILLKEIELAPPYTIIYLAKKYKLEDGLVSQLWGNLQYSERRRAIQFFLNHAESNSLKTSGLPSEIIEFSKALGDGIYDKEDKGWEPLTLPTLMLAEQKRPLKKLAAFIEEKDYCSIFREIEERSLADNKAALKAGNPEREYYHQLLKQFSLDSKDDSANNEQITETVSLLRAVYGSDIAAYDFILNNSDFRKNLDAQRRLLSFYSRDHGNFLPTQWLAHLLIHNKTLKIAPLRRLIYLTEKREQKEVFDSSVLDQETVFLDDHIKSFPYLKKLGDVEKLAVTLGLTDFTMTERDYLPGALFSRDVHGIIGEYLHDTDVNNIAIREFFRALRPQTLITSQNTHIKTHIHALTLIISEVQALPKREARNTRLLFLAGFLAVMLAALFFLLSRFINRENIQDRIDILDSDDWRQCQTNGYYAVSVPDIGASGMDGGQESLLDKGECRTLSNYTKTVECNQLCTDYSRITFPFWLFMLDCFTGAGLVACTGGLALWLKTAIHNWRYGVSSPIFVPTRLLDKINIFFDSMLKPQLTQPQPGERLLMSEVLPSLEEQKAILESRLPLESKDSPSSPLRHLSIVAVGSGSGGIQTDQDPLIEPLLT